MKVSKSEANEDIMKLDPGAHVHHCLQSGFSNFPSWILRILQPGKSFGHSLIVLSISQTTPPSREGILSSEKWLHNYKLTFNNTGIQNEEHLRCPTTSSFVGIFELLKNISEKITEMGLSGVRHHSLIAFKEEPYLGWIYYSEVANMNGSESFGFCK
ncbi:hypothetical protein MS3_00005287 [Schistosoma haematobium]|uniref:Uncharacterized protein n=1 Tax=Schistosoma haematobium TaxID=6185 RepID=A0A6A5D9N4_SCHHA|nr:hypothetical protein MS3_00005287 [Schistosoma haematobium]KAH9587602.1 hypothetical protein MS3_00005287 [Schistosoma haematobium]